MRKEKRFILSEPAFCRMSWGNYGITRGLSAPENITMYIDYSAWI